jgi:hypothetical protein
MSSKSKPKKDRFARLKAKLPFRGPVSPAATDADDSIVENSTSTFVARPSELSDSTEQSLSSQVLKPSTTAPTSVVHVSDSGQHELNQCTPASTSVGQPGTVSSGPSQAPEPVSTPQLSLLPKGDMWQEALGMLSKETKQQIEEMGVGDPKSQSISDQINDLVNIAKTKQEECEKKFWRFHIGDHEIIIRDYAVKIVGWLQKIGDIAVQFAPPQASLPWAAIKVVMQVRVPILVQSV